LHVVKTILRRTYGVLQPYKLGGKTSLLYPDLVERFSFVIENLASDVYGF